MSSEIETFIINGSGSDALSDPNTKPEEEVAPAEDPITPQEPKKKGICTCEECLPNGEVADLRRGINGPVFGAPRPTEWI